MTALAKITVAQNLEEVSVQLLDAIYYSGYTEKMSKENAEKIAWELAEMQRQFPVKK